MSSSASVWRGRVSLVDLIKREGATKVAKAIGRTERQLQDIRLGYHPLTVDDLFALVRQFPYFDVKQTVLQIGERRESDGRSRLSKTQTDHD